MDDPRLAMMLGALGEWVASRGIVATDHVGISQPENTPRFLRPEDLE